MFREFFPVPKACLKIIHALEFQSELYRVFEDSSSGQQESVWIL